MKKIPFLILILLVTTTAMGQTTQADKNKRYFDINKSIDIFNSVIRELDMFYVDSVKVDSLINSTIRTMLARWIPIRSTTQKRTSKIFNS